MEKLKSLYEEAIAAPGIVGLTIGTRPDCVPDEVLDMLAELNERVWVTVEYGVQTVHDRTLEIINRGHTYSQFLDALERTRSRGLDAGVHMILGLPGETEGDMLESARAISLLDIQAVKIHLLYVIRGTVLEKMYNNGDYHCLTREQYISVLCDFISLLPPHMVIHRLTGDPHPHELAAPEWALGKDENLDIIRKTMSERGVFQGSGFGGGGDTSW